MKRLWTFLTRPDLAFWLLIATAATLCWGTIVAQLNVSAIKQLNDTLFQDWLRLHAAEPALYLWIFVVFVLLTFLAVNTLACTTSYLARTLRTSLNRRRAAVILFHTCFLIFLLGHLISTFSGTNTAVSLGASSPDPTATASLRLLSLHRNAVIVQGQRIPLTVQAEVELLAPQGPTRLHLATFAPAFAHGQSYHLALRGKGSSQIQIIVRRDYGLFILIAGAVLTLCALACYTAGLFNRRTSEKG